ncbi:gag-pol polyprotein [Tanacetum coccineum]
MSTSNIHQQSLADDGSETRPPMLERGPGEATFLVYNRFHELMIDMEQNLHYLATCQYHTYGLRLFTNLMAEVVNLLAQRCLDKSYDPLALVATILGSLFREIITLLRLHNPKSSSNGVDYDDDYQKDVVQTNSRDPLTSVMMLVARAITQRFSNPTNNHLRTSSNTRNQAIIQGDRVNIQSRNSGNDGRNTRRAIVQEEVVEGTNVQNDAGNIQRTLRTMSSGTTANVQCYNCSEKGHYARNFPKPRVRDSKYFMEQMLLAKQDEAGVILTDEQNDFLFADASRMEEIEELSANICLMARI